MNISIKRLTKELLEDYLHFFDTTPHDDGIDEHKCYCVCWSSADIEGEDDSTAKARRSLASKYVSNGSIQGYLAYDDDKVIGWCNVNEKKACGNSRAGRMYLQPLLEDAADSTKILAVFCFVIVPELRRTGIATKLLEKVCEDAYKEGYDYIESYPTKEFSTTQYEYSGPKKMYDKLGFVTHKDLGDRLVMRKKC